MRKGISIGRGPHGFGADVSGALLNAKRKRSLYPFRQISTS